MKIKRRTIGRGRAWVKALVVAAASLSLFPGADAALGAKAPRRQAAVFFSDGTVRHGNVLLTPGLEFRLVVTQVEKGAQPLTSSGFNKVRNFNVNVISEMTFNPGVESYKRHYKFADADPSQTVTEKIYTGEPYPIRKPTCTVTFNSGEKMTGILSTVVLYLEEKDPDSGVMLGNRKYILKSKQTGKSGEKLSDLVYITRIKMLDDGTDVSERLAVEFLSFDAGSAADLKALTQGTLTSVPVKVNAENKKTEVLSTFGENVFLAARVGDSYVVGWPAEGTNRTDLFNEVEKQFLKKQDYYNERKLLGIQVSDSGTEVLTLASLRRQVPDNAVLSYPGWFEVDANGELMEFFRLSVWRWQRDPESGYMAMVDRGSFYRVRINDQAETPQARVCPELWPIVKTGARIVVGEAKKDGAK